jgi:hypothetical protein
MNMRQITMACVALMIASAFPADARSHRRAHHSNPVAHDTVQGGKSSAGDKASADADEAMDKRIKSICRGC